MAASKVWVCPDVTLKGAAVELRTVPLESVTVKKAGPMVKV